MGLGAASSLGNENYAFGPNILQPVVGGVFIHTAPYQWVVSVSDIAKSNIEEIGIDAES